jgi:DNA-binding transcriptional regulator YbjK
MSDLEVADGSRRDARREAQSRLGREHVLDAAEEVFSRHGFHEATIKEIARVAEFSVGAVYGFFENPAALVVRGLERRGAPRVPALRTLVCMRWPTCRWATSVTTRRSPGCSCGRRARPS